MSISSPLNSFNQQTKLCDLNLDYLEVVLEEIFHIPPRNFWSGFEETYPETIADLVNLSKTISADKVLLKLREITKASSDIDISTENFRAIDNEKLLMLDVRRRECLWRHPIPNAWPFYEYNVDALLPLLRSQGKTIVCISTSGRRGFSVAMSLRNLNVPSTFNLKGGWQAIHPHSTL